jgi:hypothetical protein
MHHDIVDAAKRCPNLVLNPTLQTESFGFECVRTACCFRWGQCALV